MINALRVAPSRPWPKARDHEGYEVALGAPRATNRHSRKAFAKNARVTCVNSEARREPAPTKEARTS
jgi:hypothetical protein